MPKSPQEINKFFQKISDLETIDLVLLPIDQEVEKQLEEYYEGKKDERHLHVFDELKLSRDVGRVYFRENNQENTQEPNWL